MLQNCLLRGDRKARVNVNASQVKKAVFENPNTDQEITSRPQSP